MPTEPSVSRDRIFRFGPFELLEREAELRKNGRRIKLQEQSFRVLVELTANAGKVVSREELQQKLWAADTFVDFDVGLNTTIRKLRQTLGDDADQPHYIETLAKRGYRFIAAVNCDSTALPPNEGGISSQAHAEPLGNQATRVPLELGTEPVAAEVSKKRSWYWALLPLCALALLIYGARLVWQRAHATPPLTTEQRITANPPEAPVTAAVISPDGKYVAYSDTTGVYIRHIDTGETRRLQLPKDFDAVPTNWFPDGTHLLMSSGAPYGLVRSGPEGPSLWKVSLLGGNPQKLIENASGGAVSPDGSKIAFLRGDVWTSREIWVMGTDGSNLRIVVNASVPQTPVVAGWTLNEPYYASAFSGVAWSPDGSRLVYLRRLEADKPGPLADKHTLETIEINGGTPKVLKVSRQLLRAVCWAADGRLLYGYQDNPASERMDYGVWSVGVSQKSGEPEGKEVQLSKGAGRLGGLSVSADGKRAVLWRDNLSPAVFLTELDPQTHRFTKPRRLTFDENPSIVTDWTADSRALLFVSNRSGGFKLFRQAIDQTVPEVLVEGHSIFQPRVSPDGTEILYLAGYNPEGHAEPGSVMAVPLAGGPPRAVMHMPFVGYLMCARISSKLCLLANSEQAIWFDPKNGEMQPFTAFRWSGIDDYALSPDGAHLALVYKGSQHKIVFVTLSDNSRREVELKESHFIGKDWSADNKRIFVVAQSSDRSPVVLDVEPSGNHRVLLEGDRFVVYWWAIPSPDQRHWALQEATGENNVWMLEHF